MYTILYTTHMPCLVAVVGRIHVPILYTTHMPCLIAVVDRIHVHIIVHYTHAMSYCCCWPYPCTQYCTLHTCHVLLLLLTVSMYTILYTTHMPCLVAVVDCIHVPILNTTHMPCLVAIADRIHVHNIVHYTHAMSCCYC